MEQVFLKIADAIRYGKKDEIEKLADEVVAKKINPVDAIQKGGVAGLDKLGKDFENLEAFLPELMEGGETMKVLINKLTPHLEEGKSALVGTVVIGTVKGDLHDIGKNLVGTTLSVNGFNVIDLGVDVNNNKFIEEAKANNADIIALSSLLTTSAYYIEDFINRLKEDGLRSNYKVIVIKADVYLFFNTFNNPTHTPDLIISKLLTFFYHNVTVFILNWSRKDIPFL
jgi:methanogenic corrinoid protein MtbC1